MLKLFRTICNTDHKGRPNHLLTLVGVSDLRGDLIKAMDEDVFEWHRDAVTDYNNGLEEDEDKIVRWEFKDLRFEMDRKPNGLRSFADLASDGCRSTICYHILEG